MLVYGPPFADVGAAGEEARHSRPCVWINLVGKDDTWPLRTLSLEQLRKQGRKQEGEQGVEQLQSSSSTIDPLRRGGGKAGLEHAWTIRSGDLAETAAAVRRRLIRQSVGHRAGSDWTNQYDENQKAVRTPVPSRTGISLP